MSAETTNIIEKLEQLDLWSQIPEIARKRAKNNNPDPEFSNLIKAMQCYKDGQPIRLNLPPSDYVQLIKWGKFYRDWFQMELDLETFLPLVPKPKKDFDALIVISQSITINDVWIASQRKYSRWKIFIESLQQVITGNERNPLNGGYVLRTRGHDNADEKLKNKSALNLQDEKVETETCLEYLLQHGFIWATTGKHIDEKTVTLCSGSRCADGRVPSGYWYDGKLCVDGYSPDRACDGLRGREVVSIKS